MVSAQAVLDPASLDTAVVATVEDSVEDSVEDLVEALAEEYHPEVWV